MFAVERRKTPGRLARRHDIRIPQQFLSRPRCSIVPSSDTSPSYMSFVSKAIIWERDLCNHSNHSVPYQGPLLCSRFLCHMKTHPEDVRPPCFFNFKSRPQHLCQEKPHAQSPSSPKNQQIEGHLDLKENKKNGDFHQKPLLKQSAAGASGPSLCSTTPLPKIKPKPHNIINPHHERPPVDATPAVRQSPQTFSATLQDALFEKTEEILSNITKTNSRMKLSQSPLDSQSSEFSDSLSLISCSDLSRPPSSLFSHSLDLTPGRSSNLSIRTSAESTDPEGIICSPPVHSSRVLQTPVAPHHASLPLFSPANLSTYSLISSKPNGQTKAPSLPRTSPVAHTESKGGEADVELKCLCEETQFELGHVNTSGHSTVPVCAKSSCPSSPLLPSADTSLKLTPSPPISRLGSLWPVLPPITGLNGRCNTAASCSSELSCSQSQVFDELDAIAPLSASCSSMDQPSESSQCASKNTAFCSDALSPGLAALTVGCDSRHLGSMSRVQLLLLNRQETDAVSPFSLDEDPISMENYPDLEMNNGVWRPLTAGSISEKCGSTGKAHQNKLDDIEQCSGSSSSWIIDPAFNIFKSSDSQCNSSLGPVEDEVVPFKESSNYLGFAEEDEDTCSITERREVQDRKREERKTKVLRMLSKLQDDAPQQLTNSRGLSNFEDFDFLAKYCIFNHERLAEYKRAFEEEDSDGDGYISCLQVLCALKNIIPPELLSEEEEIYVYRILEMVDFRVTDGLVDLRLFAVIASLAQKIATLDDFMRSLISSIDFRSLEVKLFKAKKLFLFLLEEQTGDGTSQQKYISPEQLILELKAGGICLEHEAAIRMEIQHIPPLDLLDFLAYLPLFMLIHKSVIANPLEDFCNL